MELLSLQRAQVWFLEAVQQTTVDMYERIVVMLESALFHQNDASTLIQDAYTPVRRDGQVEMDEEEHRIRQQAPDGAPLIGSYVASEYPV